MKKQQQDITQIISKKRYISPVLIRREFREEGTVLSVSSEWLDEWTEWFDGEEEQ